ncbi:MAG TPA: substrate-binding domain-containing protein [Mycobacteriales bacterium]|jgi:ABC-type sugar transport system, periplasmic component
MSEHDEALPLQSRRNILRASALAALGASALAACSTSGGKSAAATPGATASNPAPSTGTYDYSGLKGKTVGVVGVAITSESVGRIAKTAQQLGKENGFQVDVVDTNGDYKRASDTLKLFADKGYAAVIGAVVDPNLMKEGAQALADRKIPLGGCFAGGTVGDLSFDVTSDEWISGARVGTYAAQRLAAAGREGGVAILNWTPVPALVIREAQWRAMLDFHKIPVLDRFELKVPGQVVDTGRITTDLLTKYPANGKLLAILAGWDEVGLAASNAVKAAGRKDVFVVSIDGNLGAFDAIRNGDPLKATCANDMATVTRACLSELSNLVGGGKLTARTVYVDAPLITASNVPPQGQFPTGTGVTPFYTGA